MVILSQRFKWNQQRKEEIEEDSIKSPAFWKMCEHVDKRWLMKWMRMHRDSLNQHLQFLLYYFWRDKEITLSGKLAKNIASHPS